MYDLLLRNPCETKTVPWEFAAGRCYAEMVAWGTLWVCTENAFARGGMGWGDEFIPPSAEPTVRTHDRKQAAIRTSQSLANTLTSGNAI